MSKIYFKYPHNHINRSDLAPTPMWFCRSVYKIKKAKNLNAKLSKNLKVIYTAQFIIDLI